MRRRLLVPVLCIFAPWILLPKHVQAQATCASLLTDKELRAAVGAEMSQMGPMESEGAESTCTWMLMTATPPKRVTVIFVRGAKDFEKQVAPLEALGMKREALSGIGVKAALVYASPMIYIAVQQREGIARINTKGLTREQTIAVAKAVATP